MPSIVYLVGPPASGKRTIGEALSTLTGAALVDNHLINDPIFRPYGADGITPLPGWLWDLVQQVRDATLTAARQAMPHVSHIFTNYLADKASEAEAVTELRDLAAHRSAQFLPVWLTCPPDELLRRVTLPDRERWHKMRDPEALQRLIEDKGMLAPPADALVLDTSTLGPDEAARKINDQLAGS